MTKLDNNNNMRQALNETIDMATSDICQLSYNKSGKLKSQMTAKKLSERLSVLGYTHRNGHLRALLSVYNTVIWNHSLRKKLD
jgi:hypothetical protein